MEAGTLPKISVCGPRDRVPNGVLRLCVGSWSPRANPTGWKDLWKLSPLAPVSEGIAVPGLSGVRSKTVENAWQFLKAWPDPGVWLQEEALAAFASDVAIRYPRGKGACAIGHYWGETGQLLDYVTARKRIYVSAYLELLARPDRREVIERLRTAALAGPVAVWDPDSYDISAVRISNIAAAIEFLGKPFAHAFIVAMAVLGTTKAVSVDAL